MAIDGKILARAKTALEEKRRENDDLYERRLKIACDKAPRLRIIDDEIRVTMAQLISAALSAGADGIIEEIRLKNLELQEERRSEIIRAGFPPDYLEDDYMCHKCNDTGYVRSSMCDCLNELYLNEQRKSLSSLLRLGGETFDNFDLTYYSEEPAPETGISPRRTMEIIYETCVEYARKFSVKSMNLFFNGAPGLGKTFLSACIARVVAENGYSVVYDMASDIFSVFEDAKFARTEDQEEVRAEIKRYMECDLLIIDDLGTEMTTSFTVSALFEIVNTRLRTGKKTLVSSNMTLNELRRRYSEQIMSRLEGEYQVLTFRGEDIRKLRNRI